MKPQIRTAATLLICLPLLWQCVASDQEMRSMNLRYYSLKSRIDALESSSQKQYARLANDMDRLRNEFMQVKATIEEETHVARQLQEDKKATSSRIDRRLQDLDREYQGALAEVRKEMHRLVSTLKNEVEAIKKTRLQEAALQAEKAAMAAEKARKQALAAQVERQHVKQAEQPQKITPRITKKKTAAAPPTSTPIRNKTDETAAAASTSAQIRNKTDETASGTPPQYRQGLELFRNKEFDKAFLAFSTYLEKNPGTPLEADVRFLIGETLYEQGKFDIAILEYQKIIDNFPYHDKAAAALMKQAMCFEKNNDAMTARILYERLIQAYPKSVYAKDAEKKMRALKK